MAFGYQILGFGSGVSAAAAFSLNYLVVAGGGGSGDPSDGNSKGGGGGAGGYRASGFGPCALQGCTIACVEAGTYAIVVGGGGPASGCIDVGCGNDSSFAVPSPIQIVSAGGGHGGAHRSAHQAGGSGGGGAPGVSPNSGAAGNTPPTCPPQGNPGGSSNGESPPIPQRAAGGGGGAVGNGSRPCGGAGAPNAISGSAVTYAAGGGGTPGAPCAAGSANTGDGGNGKQSPNIGGFAGGSGVVIIRLPACATVAVSPGCNSTGDAPDCASYKIATFTVSGCLTLS